MKVLVEILLLFDKILEILFIIFEYNKSVLKDFKDAKVLEVFFDSIVCNLFNLDSKLLFKNKLKNAKINNKIE